MNSSSTGHSFRAAPTGSRATVPMTARGTVKGGTGVHVQVCDSLVSLDVLLTDGQVTDADLHCCRRGSPLGLQLG